MFFTQAGAIIIKVVFDLINVGGMKGVLITREYVVRCKICSGMKLPY